jgi:hypothetical protein
MSHLSHITVSQDQENMFLALIFKPFNIADKCVEVLQCEADSLTEAMDRMEQPFTEDWMQLFTYRSQLEKVIECRKLGQVLN